MVKVKAARALAERGFNVLPVKPGAKFPPLWENWPERATRTIPADWPADANVAIHARGFVVLDVDVRNGGDATIAEIAKTRGLPATLTTLTPTGGRHLFYRLPEGHPGVPNGTNKLGPGIDVKSTNGYVLAPGSEVPAGRYRFEADVPIADAPEWIVRELGTSTIRERTQTVNVPDAPADVVERAREWLKDRPVGDEAFKTACGLRDFGLSPPQALVLLSAHDGRPEDTLYTKVLHAYRYAQNEPGSKAASAEDFPVVSLAPIRPPRRILRLSDIAKQRTGPYLVKGLLQKASHAVVYGAPGEGKTFVALDLSYHIAADREWMGRKVAKGPVLYLAYEGLGGLATRAQALVRHYGNPDVPLFITGANYNLCDLAGRQALAQDLAQLPEKPVLIVIDTLARALHGDENSAQDMGNLNKAVGALIEATGATVVLVHHSGKNKATGARGSSALLGAIDTEIQVDSKQVFVRKQRDIEQAHPIGFKLTAVHVGMDDDGDPVTSCVVEPSVPIVDRVAGLKGNTQMVWDVLCSEFDDNKPVSLDVWRAACHAFLPERADSQRKSFWRSVQVLVKRGLVEKTEDGKWQRRME